MTKEKLEEFLVKLYKLQEEYDVQLWAKEYNNLVLYSLIGDKLSVEELVCWFNHAEIYYTDAQGNQIRVEVK